MALVTCPECGRERVSDTAEACPDCGYGVRAHFDKIKKRKKEKKRNEKRRKRERKQKLKQKGMKKSA